MAGQDIFSIQPPQWLTELVTMDTARPGREAFALGLAARRQQDESKLLGLRVQAQMLASQARIQQLENANEAAALHLRVQDGMMQLSQARLKLAQDRLQREVTDAKTYEAMYSTLDLKDRNDIRAMNPNGASGTFTPQQTEEILNRHQAKFGTDISGAVGMGLTPSQMTFKGPNGETITLKSDAAMSNIPQYFKSPGGREIMVIGTKHIDLNDMPQVDRFRASAAEKDMFQAIKAEDEAKATAQGAKPDSKEFLNWQTAQAARSHAQDAFYSILKPYELHPQQPATPSPTPQQAVPTFDQWKAQKQAQIVTPETSDPGSELTQ